MYNNNTSKDTESVAEYIMTVMIDSIVLLLLLVL